MLYFVRLDFIIIIIGRSGQGTDDVGLRAMAIKKRPVSSQMCTQRGIIVNYNHVNKTCELKRWRKTKTFETEIKHGDKTPLTRAQTTF